MEKKYTILPTAEKFLCKAKKIDWEEWVPEQRWVQGFPIVTGDRCFLITQAKVDRFDDLYISSYVEIDPSTICRNTGAHDKNGKIVFEYDIVADGGGYTAEIIWDDDELQYVADYECELMTLGECGEWCSVVGSIFDNSEIIRDQEKIQPEQE